MTTATLSDSELRLKLDCARWWALTNQPFYGSLVMSLVDVLDNAVPTACTNGKQIRWGTDFLAKLTDEEIRFVLLHETMHCAHQHLWRLPPDKEGNIAGDFCINRTLESIANIKMPKGGLVCPPEYMDLAEEEIYTHLTRKSQQPPEQKQDSEEESDPQAENETPEDGNGSSQDDADGPESDGKGSGQEEGSGHGSGPPDAGNCGSFEAPEVTQPQDEDAPLQEQWERKVIEAAQVANATRGTTPADMQRIIDRAKFTPVDWRREMAEFVRNAVSQRNDWSRAARRHAWQSVIYPRKRADDFATIIFARDTSGSISQTIIADFTAMIESAIAEVGCRAVVLDCDAEIHAEYRLEPGMECPLIAVGGGGTSHLPIFEYADHLAEQGEQIAGIVCLTDLETSFPADSAHATLWLSTTSHKAPFGRTVKIS